MSKIGIFSFESDTSADPALLAKRAEELGFELFWLAEHPVLPLETRTPYHDSPGVRPEVYRHIVDPFIALARASGVATTIKLGPSVCLVPERNPLLLAKEIATLDRSRAAVSYSASALAGSKRKPRSWEATSTIAGAKLASQ